MRLGIHSGAIVALSFAATTAFGGVVYSNNATGDGFTNTSTLLNRGQAVGATGWYYNNVRGSGTIGIDDANPRSGNGSVYMRATSGSSKGDIEYLSGATANILGNWSATASLGLFSQFTGMQYDWYRDSSSTNSAVQHPALRILLDRDGDMTTTSDRGGLVFERAYNVAGNAPTDQWVTDLVGASTNLWSFGLGLNGADTDGGYAYDSSLSEWQTFLGDAAIIGFSAGFGSGWGPFTGAVDNIGWTINRVTTTTNFETQARAVPEPGSLALVGLSLGLLGWARRRG